MGKRTNVYIDGFNLYYGALRGTPHKWLDVDALCRALLPRHDIARIRYFIAKVDPRPHDPDQPVRQLAYLRAISTRPNVEVHYGSFITKPVSLPTEASAASGGPLQYERVIRAEEKGSDVNLAAHLLMDAFRKDAECAVIISNDSDLLTPIRMARNELGLLVGALLPRERGSIELKKTVNFWKPIRAGALGACQLPSPLRDANGTISKPARW